MDAIRGPVLISRNYLDRQNIASAKLAGITTDLGLSTTQYNTCVAVLFAGYVALQIPSNMLASKIPIPGICESLLVEHASMSIARAYNFDRYLLHVYGLGYGQCVHWCRTFIRRSCHLSCCTRFH
jgi:hypothetical protein